METWFRKEKITMKCLICKHGCTQPGKMTATFERGSTTIVVKEVPADVCDSCGEEYLSEEISSKLLQQAEDAVKAGIQVDVRLYKAAPVSYFKDFSVSSILACSPQQF